ncbi:MAG: cation transporter [Defluviitaleaceae bacterium]|nr:cation transporter [Defluviitaleaceae bacterium]
MEKLIINVEGMSCGHCEKAVKNALIDLGVKSANPSFKKKTVEVVFSPEVVSKEAILAEIKELGYSVN